MDQRAQVFALDKFHGDELQAIRFRQVVNADNVPMRHLTRENQLLLETFDNGGTVGQIRADHLECHDLIYFTVFSLVDGSHTSPTKEFKNLIAQAKNALWPQEGVVAVGRPDSRFSRHYRDRSRRRLGPNPAQA